MLALALMLAFGVQDTQDEIIDEPCLAYLVQQDLLTRRIRAEQARLDEFLEAAAWAATDSDQEYGFTHQLVWLQASQTAWEGYRQLECRSQGARSTVEVEYLRCFYRMTFQRTHDIWDRFLRGDDGVHRLPEPERLPVELPDELC